MTEEEYKQVISDYGFSAVMDSLATPGMYYVAFYGDKENWHNAFAAFDTEDGEVTIYPKLYFEKSQGICILSDNKIETKDINELRSVVKDLAEQYKNLLVLQKKEEIKKDFEND